jgi:hypothetical protein
MRPLEAMLEPCADVQIYAVDPGGLTTQYDAVIFVRVNLPWPYRFKFMPTLIENTTSQ